MTARVCKAPGCGRVLDLDSVPDPTLRRMRRYCDRACTNVAYATMRAATRRCTKCESAFVPVPPSIKRCAECRAGVGIPHACTRCGVGLVQRPGEAVSAFNTRRTCGCPQPVAERTRSFERGRARATAARLARRDVKRTLTAYVPAPRTYLSRNGWKRR